MKDFICLRCETPQTGGNRRKYCDECRVLIKRERGAEDYQKHKDKRDAQISVWRKAKGPEYERERYRRMFERDPEAVRARARKRSLAYHHRNRDKQNAKIRARRMVRNFGITVAQYDEMLEKQGGVCAICGQACSSGRRLAIDHDHETGRVRALLCGNCNNGMGKFLENPDLLRKAANYIEMHKKP